MREFLRDNAALAILINSGNPVGEAERRDAEAASRSIGQRLEVLTARKAAEIDTAFAELRQRRIAALIISSDTLFFSQMQRLAALAFQHRVPKAVCSAMVPVFSTIIVTAGSSPRRC